MIPRDFITEWRAQAPWISDAQVEQDLVISKALVDLFSDPAIREALAFRGGTALYKLYLKAPARYSEDIDLVQVNAEPAGPVMDTVCEKLNPWLGDPRYKQTEGRVSFYYRFESEDVPVIPLKLKVEINTREHFAVNGYSDVPFEVSSRWFEGSCRIKSYDLNELLGTKLRAHYQRRKGRDLFDLTVGLTHQDSNPDMIVRCFKEYMAHCGHEVSREQFENNLADKLKNRNFIADISPLLASDYEWDLNAAANIVREQLIQRLDD